MPAFLRADRGRLEHHAVAKQLDVRPQDVGDHVHNAGAEAEVLKQVVLENQSVYFADAVAGVLHGEFAALDARLDLHIEAIRRASTMRIFLNALSQSLRLLRRDKVFRDEIAVAAIGVYLFWRQSHDTLLSFCQSPDTGGG